MIRPDYSRLEEILRHYVDRGAGLEERGTETNSFNAVLGVRLGTRIFLSSGSFHELSLRAAPR